MYMKVENLVKIKSYADLKGVTVPWIWRLVKRGKLEYIQIDGACFIELTDEELKKYAEYKERISSFLNSK